MTHREPPQELRPRRVHLRTRAARERAPGHHRCRIATEGQDKTFKIKTLVVRETERFPKTRSRLEQPPVTRKRAGRHRVAFAWFWRAWWLRYLARFPHVAIEHHRRAPAFDTS
jgi:hypothetical protein